MADVPFFAGRKGSEFIIRQLAPGANDANPTFNQIVFDSRGYPGRVLGTGEFLASGATVVGIAPYQAVGAGETTIAHELGQAPTLVLATACPVKGDGSPDLWYAWYANTNANGSFPTNWRRQAYGGDVLGNKYCSPFIVDLRYSNSIPGASFLQLAGWRFTWDATSLKVFSYLCDKSGATLLDIKLRVRWTALEI